MDPQQKSGVVLLTNSPNGDVLAEEYPNLDEIRAQAVRKLPWGHISKLSPF